MRFRASSNAVSSMLVIAMLVNWSCATEQSAMPASPLDSPNATLSEEFGHVISVRELHDGRVLVSDDRDKKLVVGDFAANTAHTIGRIGNGPGEYTVLGRLWPLEGDSTMMSEPYRARWHFLVGDTVISSVSDVGSLKKMPSQIVLGMTGRRDVLLQQYTHGTGGKMSLTDSNLVVRIGWTGTPVDTIARLAPPESRASREPVAAASSGPGTAPPGASIYAILVEARDQAVVFRDGTLAIVRGNPYRVDWSVGGKPIVAGKTISAHRPAMTQSDQAAYAKALRSVTRTAARETDIFSGWPEKIPPFSTPGGADEASVWPTAKGNVVVERVPTAASPTYTYDVIDRSGARVAVFSVPLGTYLIGFGGNSAYTVNVDNDGIQRVQRHAWTY